MGMIRLLVALYPKKWRATFGEEFAALLEHTRLPPAWSSTWWSARESCTAQVTGGWLSSSRRCCGPGVMLYLSVHAPLTANILWAPTTPARALADHLYPPHTGAMAGVRRGHQPHAAWVTCTRERGAEGTGAVRSVPGESRPFPAAEPSLPAFPGHRTRSFAVLLVTVNGRRTSRAKARELPSRWQQL